MPSLQVLQFDCQNVVLYSVHYLPCLAILIEIEGSLQRLLTSVETWVSWIIDKFFTVGHGSGGFADTIVHNCTSGEEWPVSLQDWKLKSLNHCYR